MVDASLEGRLPEQPDVVLLGIADSDEMTDLGVIGEIRDATDAAVLVLSLNRQPGVIENAFEKGASGYLWKRDELFTDTLGQAIRDVNEGQLVLSPTLRHIPGL